MNMFPETAGMMHMHREKKRCWFKEHREMTMLMCLIGALVLGWALIGFPIWVILLMYKMYAAIKAPATFTGMINGSMPITGTFGY